MEHIREFGKVITYKISTQKSITFLYTNKVLAEEKLVKSGSFTIAIKYVVPGDKFNQKCDVKDLYKEKYKSLMREIEEDIKSGRFFNVY